MVRLMVFSHLGGSENWSGLMQPPLIGSGCSIPGTRPGNQQVMRSVHFLQDDNSDADLGEVQGSPLLPEEKSRQDGEGSRGPLRNQNLQMDLVDALMNNSDRIMDGSSRVKRVFLPPKNRIPIPLDSCFILRSLDRLFWNQT